MFKHIGLGLLLSLIIVFFSNELAFILRFIIDFHKITIAMMSKIFAGGSIGILIRNSIALFLIPFIVAIIPTSMYWLIKKKEFKYFSHVFWISWIILATVLVTK